MKYRLTSKFAGTIVVDLPWEKREERTHIPLKIYKACWLDRLFNTNVTIERFDDNHSQVIYHWPARKMGQDEIVLNCT